MGFVRPDPETSSGTITNSYNWHVDEVTGNIEFRFGVTRNGDQGKVLDLGAHELRNLLLEYAAVRTGSVELFAECVLRAIESDKQRFSELFRQSEFKAIVAESAEKGPGKWFISLRSCFGQRCPWMKWYWGSTISN